MSADNKAKKLPWKAMFFQGRDPAHRSVNKASSDSRVDAIAAMLIAIACGVFLVVAPNIGVLASAPTSYNLQRFLQLGLLAVLVLFVLLPIGRQSGVWSGIQAFQANRILTGLVAGVFLLGILSSFLAPRPWYGLREVALFFLLLALAAALAGPVTIFGVAFSHAAARVISFAALLYLIAFFLHPLLVPSAASQPGAHPFIGFAHPRFFGQFQSWTIPLIVLPLLIQTSHRLQRLVYWAIAGGWYTLFLLSGTRGTLLGLLLATLSVMVFFGRLSIPWLRTQAGALLIGVVGYAVLSPFVHTAAFKAGYDTTVLRATTTGRWALWEHSLGLWEKSPWLGIGPSHSAFYPPPPGVFRWWAHPHSSVIQWVTEWGIISAAIVLGLLVWGGWVWIRDRQRDLSGEREPVRQSVSVALTASVIAASGHSLVSGVIVMPVSQTVGAMIIGWAVGVYLSRRRQLPGKSLSTGKVIAVKSILVAALATLFATSSLPIEPMVPGKFRSPRFWVHDAIP